MILPSIQKVKLLDIVRVQMEMICLESAIFSSVQLVEEPCQG